MNNTKRKYQSSTAQQIEKFSKLKAGVKNIIKSLDQVEVEAYAAHFYQYQELHKKYLNDGTYNEFWNIFRALKEGRI
ncbi:hypothetical protein FJY90_06580 [Candidatus Gottesmanbacteria bacterium]|nr:hypothetical protein [Candidatus Gottesmanbacteria bacterium]